LHRDFYTNPLDLFWDCYLQATINAGVPEGWWISKSDVAELWSAAGMSADQFVEALENYESLQIAIRGLDSSLFRLTSYSEVASREPPQHSNIALLLSAAAVEDEAMNINVSEIYSLGDSLLRPIME